jgi:hypothetical protein
MSIPPHHALGMIMNTVARSMGVFSGRGIGRKVSSQMKGWVAREWHE